MHQYNKFVMDSGNPAIDKGILFWNEKYLAENDYWIYAYQAIVFDKGGITAVIVQGRLMMNKNWLVLMTYHPNKERMLEVEVEIPLTQLKIEEVKGNFLSKIQKRDYKLRVSDISNPKSYTDIIFVDVYTDIQSKKLSQEFLQDVQEIKAGKQIVKPWHTD